MKTASIIGFAIAAMMSTSAQAQEVRWNVPARQGQVQVRLPAAQARQVKSLVGKLRNAGVKWYTNFWAAKSRASQRSYPKRNGVSLVAAVNGQSSRAWMREIGKKSIGLMCQGTPTDPHQTGEVRVGDKYFDYSTVNSGGSATGMDQYFSSPYSNHIEYTIPVSDGELKAFKAFYHARAKQAILGRDGQPLLPEFTPDGATKYRRNGQWVEGCSAASSSALHKNWAKAFKRSIDNIRRVGREQGIPSMANATPEMADTIMSLATRLGIKQQCSPQGMVRRGVYANNTRVGMMTILNDPNAPADLKLHMQLDQKYRDANREAWSGMAPVTIIPDLPTSSRGHRNFQNARVNDMSQLNALFRQIPN